MRCFMGLFDTKPTIGYNTPFTQGGFVFGNGMPSGTGAIYNNGYTLPLATTQIAANAPLQTTNIAQVPQQASSTITAGLGSSFNPTPQTSSPSYLTPNTISTPSTSTTYLTPKATTSSAATQLVAPKIETDLVKIAKQQGILKGTDTGTGTGTGTGTAINYETPSQTYQNWADSTSFGLKNSTWQGLGQGFQIANTVFNGIMGYLNYRQAKKAAEEQKALNHANYAAAAKSYNNGITSGNYIGRALVGKSYNDEDRARDDAALNNAKVSETY